jgi:3-hydroxyacyl-[acyl-carrier-protein] dehydratase
MRWIWIDKITEFNSGVSAKAIKTCTLGEDHIHDLFPMFPVFPNSLIVEAMAQIAGMLVGEARQFREKVILAKINKAVFHKLVRPGESMELSAKLLHLDDLGASTEGIVESAGLRVAEINLMFSHIDNNLAGMRFPEENFVFTEAFLDLLRVYHRENPLTV